MTPDAFITRWSGSDLSERAAAQSHFLDLCALLGEPSPAEADPTGRDYAFEAGLTKSDGGRGFADVWRRGRFAWEYKRRGADLKAAFAQLQRYAPALKNPPLLVVCDLARFRVHTNFTSTVAAVHEITLEDLRDAKPRALLKAVLSDPEALRPGVTREQLTKEVAQEFATIAERLRGRGHPAPVVAHFVTRLVFCMFAEDAGLLPVAMFTRMVEGARRAPNRFEAFARELFGAMRAKGGRVGFEDVPWFNGGLFDTDEALPLERGDLDLLAKAAALDWSGIEPALLGTLFERGLNPAKRSQLGAHYTDPATIARLIDPVVARPLAAEWGAVRSAAEARNAAAAAALEDVLRRADTLPALAVEAREVRAAASGGASAPGLFGDLKRERRVRSVDALRGELRSARDAVAAARALGETEARAFLARLRAFRVLDPACGSGAFLYLALKALHDLEHRVMVEAEALGVALGFPGVGPANVLGIELDAYAAELARATVWIGELQWMTDKGFGARRDPILPPAGRHRPARRPAGPGGAGSGLAPGGRDRRQPALRGR